MTIPLDKQEFLSKFGHAPNAVEEAGLNWETLVQIYSTSLENRPALKEAARLVATALQRMSGVRATTYRVKQPDSVINKVIRKRFTAATPENYTHYVKDLVGVRAIHLFKENWESIHDSIASSTLWKITGRPEAKVRAGDLQRFQKAFLERDCALLPDEERGYRGVHYEILTEETKQNMEVQVRTILEEAWSEVSHIIGYPSDTTNAILAPYLSLFSRLTGTADEMATHMVDLKRNLSREPTIKASIGRLEASIKTLSIGLEERRKLLSELHFLKEASSLTRSQVRFAGADLLTAYHDGPGPTTLMWPAPSPADLAFEEAVRHHKAERDPP